MGERMRSGSRTAAGLLIALIAGLFQVAAVTPAAAYPSDHVSLIGHGFGHGRGMGQYGALGYALGGASWQNIVGHYYGIPATTTLGSAPNNPIGVRLTAFDNSDTIVVQEKGLGSYNGTAFPSGRDALLVRLTGPNSFTIWSSLDCNGGGGWQPIGTIAGPVTISSPNSGDDHTTMLQACLANGATRWYRGSLVALDSGSGQRTVNQLPVESYLRGVVPRESPAFWGTMGSGQGESALQAQAVAARSYALSTNDYGYAQICDTTACQVYGGRAQNIGGVYQDLEGCGPTRTPCIPSSSNYDTSDNAVASTAGQVLQMVGSGAIARTEFSSSTGGYTAGGTFPAVPDDGDATPSNPNHTWTTNISVASIQGKYPQIGSLQSIQVTQRNGLGDMGGRVLSLAIKGGAGSVSVSGSDFAAAFGLMSNWFSITNSPSGGLNGYWLVASDGGIFSFGAAPFFGSTGAMHLNRPVVGMAAVPGGQGYWLVASDGGIFSFGSARFFGSTGGMHLNLPVVGMAAAPDGQGYWLVASDGGIFSFGSARFFGSTGAMHINRPVVGMAAAPDGKGYWLVASDGGIFAFGSARFFGSTGAMHLNQPIVGMTSRPTGSGYWLVASDGGLFAFGDAPFQGSLPSIGAQTSAAGMKATVTGAGYLIAATNGSVYSFGDAPNFGGIPDVVPNYSGHVLAVEGSPGT